MQLRHLVLTAAISGLLGGLCAQGNADANASKIEQVRTVYGLYAEIREHMQTLMREGRGLERGSDAQKELTAKLNEVRNRMQGPQQAFDVAFAAADWTRFDPKADAALLKDGLPSIVRDTEHPTKAVEAGKFFLQHRAPRGSCGAAVSRGGACGSADSTSSPGVSEGSNQWPGIASPAEFWAPVRFRRLRSGKRRHRRQRPMLPGERIEAAGPERGQLRA